MGKNVFFALQDKLQKQEFGVTEVLCPSGAEALCV